MGTRQNGKKEYKKRRKERKKERRESLILFLSEGRKERAISAEK